MSINMVISKTMSTDERNQQAHDAGHHLYNSIPSTSTSIEVTYDNDTLGSFRHRGRMSSVRRMFCLLVTFDLILSLILWVIYCQLQAAADSTESVWVKCWKQIEYYAFDSSMFDTVMLAMIRFAVLLLAYALFRLLHWWPVAITTAATCAFLLSKAFLFNFENTQRHESTSFDYIILIVAFIIAWIETWFLDFNVYTKETKQNRILASTGELPPTAAATDKTPLMNGQASRRDRYRFYSPIDTPDGSPADSDDERIHPRPVNKYLSLPSTRDISARSTPSYQNDMEDGYMVQAKWAWDIFWVLLSTTEGWNLESGKDLESGCIYRRKDKKSRRIIMLKGYVDIPAQLLYTDLVYNHDNMPTWNPTLLECGTIQALDESTDVSYDVAAEGGGGLVSSRDFVTIRRWGVREGVYVSAGVGTTHPNKPHHKKHIRGENGPGGIAMAPVEGKADRCVFTWIMDSNIKGWVPQTLVDKALNGVMHTHLASVRQRAVTLKRHVLSES